ncbi:uncharacterized protein LOC142992335 [Genypterus blacodes]|uniref:uncharacterized protein LOC142992335 n=1 Tax=Genypterus blacodes TaxID=154954 RepID=UPI003F7583A7
MSEDDISLFELVNLSIGTPDVGAVNFSALHILLHALLRQLDIREVKTKWKEAPPGPKHTEPQEPTATVEQERTASSPPPSSITVDDCELKDLHSRIEANKDGVSNALELIQDLLKEIQSLKESMKELQLNMDQMNVGALAERLAAVERCCHRVDDLEEATRSLRDTVQQHPDPEELSQFVTWDDMQSALLSEGEVLQKKAVSSVADPVAGIAAPSDANKSPDIGSTGEPTENPETGTSSADPGDHVTFPPQTPLTVHLPSSSVPNNTPAAAASSTAEHQEKPETKTQSAEASGSERYPETVEALRNLSKLKERHNELEAHVKDLQAHKADQAQLEQLKELLTDRGTRDVDHNLLDELNHQRALIDSMMGDHEKNVELVDDVQKVQAAVIQVQAECVKLHKSSGHLDEDSRRKQRLIEQLYKKMEELEEKKADKQLVRTENEMKADKCALDNKVSRVQFDSVTEQLNTMFHELLGKVSNQDQDWQKVIHKVYTEMECKSNRNELDSMKKQLEDRWKNTYKKLQGQTAPELDDAAVVRKQLVDRFNCLSCDRPIAMHTPGPQCVALPCAPGLPAHRSNRPYTVYGRPHYRSERFPEKCSSLRVSPTRRHIRVPHNTQEVLTEIEGVVQFEIDGFGQDGPIYRQRLNSPALRNTDDKLPTVSNKDGKSRDKAKRFLSHKPRGSPELRCTPAPPHSAKGQRSRSASADPCLEEGPGTNL